MKLKKEEVKEVEVLPMDERQSALYLYLLFSQAGRDAALWFMKDMRHEVKFYFNKMLKAESLLHNKLNSICGADFIDAVQDDSEVISDLFLRKLKSGSSEDLQEINHIIKSYINEKEEAKKEGREIAVKIVDFPEVNDDENINTFHRNLKIRLNKAAGTEKLAVISILRDFEKIFK